jgi:hypothetical protein
MIFTKAGWVPITALLLIMHTFPEFKSRGVQKTEQEV